MGECDIQCRVVDPSYGLKLICTSEIEGLPSRAVRAAHTFGYAMSHFHSELVLLVCLSLIIPWTIQLIIGRRRLRRHLRELEILRAGELVRHDRLIELSRMNAARDFEVRWLTCLSHPETQLEHLFELLTEDCGAHPCLVWIVNSEGDCLATSLSERNHPGELIFTPSGLRKLRSGVNKSPFRVPKSDFINPAVLQDHPCTEITFFNCSNKNPTPVFLGVTSIRRITGIESTDEALIARLCQHLVLPSLLREEQQDDLGNEELDLIRDMLSLRMLTDDQFETPQIMLREFLFKLAQLTNFERVSVYRTDCSSDTPEIIATAGMPIEPNLCDDWLKLEIELQNGLSRKNVPVRWITGPEELPPFPGAHHAQLQSALVVSHCMPEGSRTTLVLTSRWEVTRSRINTELAQWSVQFIPQALDRALAQVQIEERARRDGLTQVANRQTFDTEIQKAITSCHANQRPFSLVMLDVDHFKSINDVYGHLTGDIVLQATATTLNEVVQQTRPGDRTLVARYGGEEFAVLLPEVPLAGAMRVAEALRRTIEQKIHVTEFGHIRTTISAGVSSMGIHGNSVRSLIAAADKALYEAKRSGRNRVCKATPIDHRDDSKVPALHP